LLISVPEPDAVPMAHHIFHFRFSFDRSPKLTGAELD
jgi:hypothetical protein